MPEQILHLKKHAEFVRVASFKQKVIKSSFILQAAPKVEFLPTKNSNAFCRIGFTVSKKVGGAVERNRAKRKLKAAVRLLFYKYANPNCDYVLIGRKAAIKIPFSILVEDLQKSLEYLNTKQRIN